MSYSSIHWIGVLLCIVASFVSGFAWFGPKTFYPVWKRAMGQSPTDDPGESQNMAVTFGLTLIGIIVQAIVLALILDLLDRATGRVTLVTGLGTGLVVGIGAAAMSLGHRLFAGHGVKVWLIEVGNDILNFAIMGLILSFFY